jgi:glycosyltransferase involved in cell wall biosynthesis
LDAAILKMKIAFITQMAPCGTGEAFVLEELVEFKRQNACIAVFPMRPRKFVSHSLGHEIMDLTDEMPIFNFGIFWYSIIFAISRPSTCFALLNIIRRSRKLGMLIKNLFILPKSLYIAKQVRLQRIDHIHAYWGSTSATAAMVVSYLTGVPWSMTCYRWDIPENNLLLQKYCSASFIRCADEQGRQEIARICGIADNGKLHIVRSGVQIPEKLDRSDLQKRASQSRCFRIAVPAFFTEKKGHIYLLEAVRLLADKGYPISCWLVGDGDLRETINRHISRLRLENSVELKGFLPLEEINAMYYEGLVDVVVLPSIELKDGNKEGIPVSLVQAMAYRVPVISTLSGGIPELLKKDAGIMVPPRDSRALAEALEMLIKDPELRSRFAESGRKRVIEEFSVENVSHKLMALIKLVNAPMEH